VTDIIARFAHGRSPVFSSSDDVSLRIRLDSARSIAPPSPTARAWSSRCSDRVVSRIDQDLRSFATWPRRPAGAAVPRSTTSSAWCTSSADAARRDRLPPGGRIGAVRGEFATTIPLRPVRLLEQTTSRCTRARRIKGGRPRALDAAGIDRRSGDERARMVLEMCSGPLFHADPHPGNSSSNRAGQSAWSTSACRHHGTASRSSWSGRCSPTRRGSRRHRCSLPSWGRAVTSTAALRRDVEHLRSRYYGRPSRNRQRRGQHVPGLIRPPPLHLRPVTAALKTVLMHENLSPVSIRV